MSNQENNDLSPIKWCNNLYGATFRQFQDFLSKSNIVEFNIIGKWYHPIIANYLGIGF